jgi:multiple sugar transport system permease protein/raffinose/stachyose/melibiose transport system permease protein
VADRVAEIPSAAEAARPRRRYSLLTRRDKITLGLLVGIPAAIHIFFVWLPTLASIFLSFTTWNGVGLDKIQWVGTKNYQTLFAYEPFWPALTHNFIWLACLLFIATPIGMFFAVLLDREIRGSRLYQSALFLPVVLSLAIVGFIWTLQYAPEQGFINNVLGTTRQDNLIDWLGNSSLNLWAVIVAASWRHVGYIMVLYLAGLKSVDPALREAAAIDGASERQAFFGVVFPALRPINIVILVVTIIEGLRAFDLVYIINRGLNGLELLSVLVTNNIMGEAQRVGFGSAIAVILLLISVGPIILYLRRAMRAEQP